jgi:hypothetical protein
MVSNGRKSKSKKGGGIGMGDYFISFQDFVRLVNSEEVLKVYDILPVLNPAKEENPIYIRIAVDSLPENREEFLVDLYSRGYNSYIGRVNGISVYPDKLVLYLQNEIKVEVNRNTEIINKDLTNFKDLVRAIKKNGLIFCVLKTTKRAKDIERDLFIATRLQVVEVNTTQLPEDLLNGKPAWQLLLQAVGIKPDEKILRLFLPRMISLFKLPIDPQSSPALHTLQFTKPGSGKTTYYITLKHALNIEVLQTFPSRARLVMDARTNKKGLVFLRDYIVIDAFDKNLDKQKFLDFFSIVETGLSNGVWSVEKSVNKDVETTVRTFPTFIFLGNVSQQDTVKITNFVEANNPRSALKNFLAGMGIPEPTAVAFIDRLAIIDLNYDDIDIKDYVDDKILRAKYSRALVEYLKDKAIHVNIDTSKINLHGRQRRYAIAVAKVLKALEVTEKPEEFAVELVSGKAGEEVPSVIT